VRRRDRVSASFRRETKNSSVVVALGSGARELRPAHEFFFEQQRFSRVVATTMMMIRFNLVFFTFTSFSFQRASQNYVAQG